MNQPNREQQRRLKKMAKKAQVQPQANPQQGVIGTDYLLQEIGQQHVELSVLRRQVQQLTRENQDLVARVALLTQPDENKPDVPTSEDVVAEGPGEPTEEELTGS